MLRRRYEASFHRIIVDVIQLLLHHHIIGNRLGMQALLPDLMFARRLMHRPGRSQPLQKPFTLLLP